MISPFRGRCHRAVGLSLLAVALNWAPARAQDAPADLSLDQALQLALSTNPDIAAAESRVRSLRAAANQAAALPNPTVGLRRDDIGTLDVVNIAELSQKIEISGARSARHRAAGFDADAAQWALHLVRSRLQAEVRSGFAQLLAAQQRAQLAEEDLRLAESVAQAVGRRVAAGKVSPIEETRTRLTVGAARIERDQGRRLVETTHSALRALWGGSGDFGRAIGALEAGPELPPWPTLEARFSASPLIQQASAEIEAQRARLELEQARRIPDPSIDGAYKRYTARAEDSVLVGITIPLPLFDRNRGAVAAATAALDEANAMKRSRIAGLNAEAQAAYQHAAAAREEAALLDGDLVPSAQSAFEATRTGYELGKFGLLELLDAQRAYQQLRQQQLRARLDAVTTRAELDRLTDAGDSRQP